MKTEDQAWRALQAHAAAQLRTGFADRTLRAASGPRASVWQAFWDEAAAQLRPGFAERVLRAARVAADVPSLASQFALSATVAALCLGGVLFVHDRNVQQANARNLAEWQRIVAVVHDADASGL
jgi:hypothetical protein